MSYHIMSLCYNYVILFCFSLTYYTISCYIKLCSSVLICLVLLQYTVLENDITYCIMTYRSPLYYIIYIISYCIISLYYIVLYSIIYIITLYYVLYHILSYCIILDYISYYIISYYIILYTNYIILYHIIYYIYY